MGTNEEKKNVEVKSAEPVEKVGTSKKSSLNVLWLILGIIFAVILVIALYQGIAWLVSPERKHKADVTTYMKEKYAEEFQVKFVKKRYGAEYKTGGCDATYCTYMADINTNTTEYVYKVTPVSNSKIVSYVVYEENKETGNYKIYETNSESRIVCGNPSETDADVYQENLTCHQEKQELKGKIEYYLGKGYSVDYDSSSKYIVVTTEKSLTLFALGDWEGLESLYNNLVNLLQDKMVKIQIQYTDKTLTLSGTSKFEEDSTIKSVKPIEPVEEMQWN